MLTPICELSDLELQQLIAARLQNTQPAMDLTEAQFAGLPPESQAAVRHLLPTKRTPAAVLVPLIIRETGLTVLFTQRAAHLRSHAGQISFPGGRIEPHDAGPQAAALRETTEEIGLSPNCVEVLGYLLPQLVVSGYCVFPVVGWVRPPLSLCLDSDEVAHVFEVPLKFILNPAHHQRRQRQLGEHHIDVYDIPYESHHIWGATAGILLSLLRLLQSS